MRRLIDKLPIPLGHRNLRLPSGKVLVVKSLQPIVWISISLPQIVALPVQAPRFPALLDTGFNNTLLIQDSHLKEWAGISVNQLRLASVEPVVVGEQRWHFQLADIWLHPNVPGQTECQLGGIPYCLETYPGILTISEAQRALRLPLLGMRALARNRAGLEIVFPSTTMGQISLEFPD